jgi:lipid A 3-O-deacylase
MQVAPMVTAEASWVHMSHATLFGKQNPGIDNLGVRVTVGIP